MGDIEFINAKEKEGMGRNEGRSKISGLYFSASWCGPCRSFTPQLCSFYEKMKPGDLEIVFVSSDQDENGYKEYLGKIPGIAYHLETERV